MFDLDKWQEILGVLSKNKGRTILTAFGVFWGVMMLILMLGAGAGLKNGTLENFSDHATNSVVMGTRRTSMPYKGFPRGRWFNFRNSDIQALKDNIPEIDALAPVLEGWGNSGNNTIRKLRAGSFDIAGHYPETQIIDPVVITSGRFINYKDIEEKRKVAVVGSRIIEELFLQDEEPIGEYIRINGVYFQIVGTFKPKNEGHDMGGDKKRKIYLPFTTLQKAYNYGDVVGMFAMTSKPDIPASVVEEKALELLAARHNVHPDDKMAFWHWNMEKEFDKMTNLFTGINLLIWIVGTGTLLAGIIGISNIMMIIIRERTKEIGIKRAVGATPVSIISQIILETIILTAIAGITGLVAGTWIVEGIAGLIGSSPGGNSYFNNPEVDLSVVIKAIIILIFFGAFAGLIPARRAVKIKTIDALRYDL